MSKKRRWGVILLAVLAGLMLAAAIPVLAHTIVNGHTGQTVNAGTGAVVSSQGTSASGTPAPNALGWFGNLVVELLATLLDGFSGLFAAGHFTIRNVIAGNMMSNGAAPFGSGNWFDVVPFGRNKAAMLPFMSLFFSLGLAWLLISVYIGAARIAGGPSGRQRNIIKSELSFFVVAALLMMVGPSFAVAVSQLCYDFALYFLNLGHTNVIHWSGGSSKSSIVNLFESIVQFVQVIMTVVLYVMYQFRELLLDAWIMIFPLAMAMAANDKTRGIAKLWWTEWIFQMLVPVGQALVFGFAYAIVNTTSGGVAGVGVAEVFTSLVGVIGFIASAVYVRKMVEVVGGAFNAQVMGHTAGGMAAVAGGALAGDLMGGAMIGTMGKVAGTAGKAGFRAVDRQFAGAARESVTQNPETVGGQIARGATLDDVMANHVMAARGDPLHDAQGAGVEGTPRGGVGGASGGRGGGGSSRLARHHPFFSSHTAGAMGNIAAGAKAELAGSNMAMALKTGWRGFQNDGGIAGAVGAAGAAVIGGAAGSKVVQAIPGVNVLGRAAKQGTQSYQANRQERQTRTNEVRSHMLGVMQSNAAASRMANVNEQGYQLAHEDENGTVVPASFAGSTPAMEAYSARRAAFVNSLMTQTGIDGQPEKAEAAASAAEASWQQGGHAQNFAQWSPWAQEEYQKAHAAYRPAAQDTFARQQVLDNRVAMAPPDADPRKQQLARARNFMNDARAGILRLPLAQGGPNGARPAPFLPAPHKIPPKAEVAPGGRGSNEPQARPVRMSRETLEGFRRARRTHNDQPPETSRAIHRYGPAGIPHHYEEAGDEDRDSMS